MALVPCRRCGQLFDASYHDASCADALCLCRAYAEHAEPATDSRPAARAAGSDVAGAGIVSDKSVTSGDAMRAYRPLSPSPGGRG